MFLVQVQTSSANFQRQHEIQWILAEIASCVKLFYTCDNLRKQSKLRLPLFNTAESLRYHWNKYFKEVFVFPIKKR